MRSAVAGESSWKFPVIPLSARADPMASLMAKKTLLAKNVIVDAKAQQQSGFMSLLGVWLPFIVLIGIWLFFMNRMQGGGNGGTR